MKNIQTIITGHGKYATGIRSAIELLAGPQESFKYIDFSEGMSEEDLAKDVLEIITVFSARLYGSRSKKNQKLINGMKEAVKATQ